MLPRMVGQHIRIPLEDLMNKDFNTPHEDASKAVPEDDQRITMDKLKGLIPRGVSAKVTEDILELINDMGDAIDMPQNLLEEELMSYMHLLGAVKGVGIKDLIAATKYCNLKRNYTNRKAWSIVFPHKYDSLITAGKQVDNHVSMYNGSKLVQAIDKELLIPASLQYAPYFHSAVKKQYELMNGKAGNDTDGDPIKVTPMVMHLAAKELALITKQPEETKMSISVGPNAESLEMQSQMNEQLKVIIASQKARLEAGESIEDVQIIDINFDDIAVRDE